MDIPGYPTMTGMPPEGEHYSSQRSAKGPYKERFHATRDRYAHATQMQEEHKKELNACIAKEKALQEEVDLLIDVLGVTLVDSPTIREFMSMTPPPLPSRQLPHSGHRYSAHIPKVEERVHSVSQMEPLPHPPAGSTRGSQDGDDPMDG